jgi:imidazolonepropionase-like amidohydrolase
LIACVWVAGSALGAAPAPGAPAAPLAITNVTVIDGSGGPSRASATVLVRDGRIAAIGPAASARVPQGATRLDGTGRFLIPALVDAHVHLTMRPEAEAPAGVLLPSLVAHGVLAVRDMGGDLDRLGALKSAIAAGTLAGPVIVTPGPFVDGPQEASATVLPVATAADAEAAVRTLKARGADFVKVQAGLTIEPWRAVIAAAGREGLPVAGHVPESMSALDVVRGGQRSVEHVSPALPGDAGLLLAVSRGEEGLRAEMTAIGAAWARKDADRAALRARQRDVQRRLVESTDPARAAALFAAMRQHAVVAVPTLVWSEGLLPRTRQDIPDASTLALVPKALRERWLGRRRTQLASATDADLALHETLARGSLAFVGAMYRAGVTIAAGTDSLDGYLPPGPSLHAELARLVAAGLSPAQALKAGTSSAARLLGMEGTRGTIAAGMQADLLLLDADPTADISATRRIHAVVQNGRVHDRAALDRMLAAVRGAAGE